MSTSYPNGIDSDVEIPYSENNISEIQTDTLNNIRDAVIAIESAIGTNPQGARSSLTERVSQSLDDNGDIKTAALESKGLVTLPITNSHIGTNAAITESKLDLDYSTSGLNTKIAVCEGDIEDVTTSLGGLSYNFINHTTGASSRHDGYKIDLTSDIMGQSTVEAGMSAIENAITGHFGGTSDNHSAEDINTTTSFINFTADNVEDALYHLDSIVDKDAMLHLDRLHQTGICLNSRGDVGNNNNLAHPTLSLSIYKTSATYTNVVRVIHPNVASVCSTGIDFKNISSSGNIIISAKDFGLTPSLTIPCSSIVGAPTIENIVDLINTNAATRHYPVAAYISLGKLVISHTIAGEEYVLELIDDGLNTLTCLGFVAGVVAPSYNTNAAYISGKSVKSFDTYINKELTLTLPSAIIRPDVGNLIAIGMSTGATGRILVNILNHSSPGYNGTYYIVGFPNSVSFTLNNVIGAGTFDLVVYKDSFNFTATSNGELHDVFLLATEDGDGYISTRKRMSYQTISGVSIISISNDVLPGSYTWRVTSNREIAIGKDGYYGPGVYIPPGFVGTKQVLFPDYTNSAICEFSGNVSTLTQTITVLSNFAGVDSKLHLGTVHYSGNFGNKIVKYIVDRRQLGTSVDQKTTSVLKSSPINSYFNLLRNNGIIHGCESSIDSVSPLLIRITGGRLLLNGVVTDIKPVIFNIMANNTFSSTARYIVFVDKNGNHQVRKSFASGVGESYDTGYSLEELTSGSSYGDADGLVVLFEISFDGTNYIIEDRRLFVDKLDKRIYDYNNQLNNRIGNVEAVMQGNSWGFTVVNDGYNYNPGIDLTTHNSSLLYIPISNESASGFIGNPSITTRTFQFSGPDAYEESVFCSPGSKFVNIFMEVVYFDPDGAFGIEAGQSASLYLGAASKVGPSSVVSSDFVLTKTMSGSYASQYAYEYYVASIPVADLNLVNNMFFDLYCRIKLVDTDNITGGTGGVAPRMSFKNIRMVLSSYNIASNMAGVISEDKYSFVIPNNIL